ncbi:MAG: DUF1801 domain-containing protein [Lutimonas sp.]
MNNELTSVDDYFRKFPKNQRELLQKVRAIIKKNAPEAIEKMAYGLPSYKQYGKPLVYFGGFKNHLGLYATPAGHEEFAKELSAYKQGKGSVQFPYNTPIPYSLIERIVRFRVQQILNEKDLKI